MSLDTIPKRVLSGRHVRLEPLTLAHVEALEKSYSPEVIRFFPTHWPDARSFVEAALEHERSGAWVPFAIVSASTGRAVGSTSFLAIEPVHRRLEIGATWMGKAVQGSALNAEAKLLLLEFAFETLGCMRVELKTDSLNAQSRAAMTKLGLVEEGTFRNHLLMPGGRMRHSVYFSAIAEEWPELRSRIAERVRTKAAD